MGEAMTLQPVASRGWLRGFGPLVRAEMAGWWRTRRWLVTTGIWLAIINVFLLVMILGGRSETEADRQAQRKIVRATLEARVEQGSEAARRELERLDAGLDSGGAPDSLMLFTIFSGIFVAVGCALSVQGAVVGEKKSGTAEWVLSGPASRGAFVIAKLAGNAVGVLATSVAIPAGVAWLEMTLLQGLGLPPLGFIAGTGVIALHTLFYLTLTLMLGTLLEHWAPIIGIPLAMLIAQNFAMGPLPILTRLAPLTLVLPVGEQEAIALSLMRGAEPVTLAPVVVAAGCVILFSVVALVRFRRQEF